MQANATNVSLSSSRVSCADAIENTRKLFPTPSSLIDLIPTTSSLIETPTVEANLVRVCQAVATGSPLLLEGATGIGKTSVIVHAAKLLERPLIRFNVSSKTTVANILGTIRMSSDDGV